MDHGSHIYKCPYPYAENRVIILPPAELNELIGNPVLPAAVWCWKHSEWEDCPPELEEEYPVTPCPLS